MLRGSALTRLYAQTVGAVRRARVRHNVVRLWGPQPEPSGLDQVTVVCLMRNSEPYIRSFIAHYTAMGVQQIVLLDNGSTDRSLELLRDYDHVTLLRSPLPYKRYQFLFKEYLLTSYGRGGWRLHVDSDELFDYPHSASLPLSGLVAYLNTEGYTALVAYLLDMFAPGSLQSWRSSPDDDLRKIYLYYDISNIRARGYAEHYGTANCIGSEAIQLYWGGIRNTLFGSQDWLTKHPLLRLEDGVRLEGNLSHDVYGARVADVSGVLYHYKLIDRFVDQTAQAVREQSYWGGSRQYRRYKAVLDVEPNPRVQLETALRLGHVDELVEQGFLVASPAFDAWVKSAQNRSLCQIAAGE